MHCCINVSRDIILRTMKNGLEEKFARVYSGLPLNLRDEIVLVLPDDGPINWRVADAEIREHTEKGKYILEQLDKLGFI